MADVVKMNAIIHQAAAATAITTQADAATTGPEGNA